MLVDAATRDHVRWIARSWEGIVERWLDGYTIDVKRREADVRAMCEAPDSRVWLLVNDDGPVAMAIARIARDRFDTTTRLELDALWTAPKLRRRGHARQLLEAVRLWGRERGVQAFAAEVDTRDEATRRLLQGAGWVPASLCLVARI